MTETSNWGRELEADEMEWRYLTGYECYWNSRAIREDGYPTTRTQAEFGFRFVDPDLGWSNLVHGDTSVVFVPVFEGLTRLAGLDFDAHEGEVDDAFSRATRSTAKLDEIGVPYDFSVSSFDDTGTVPNGFHVDMFFGTPQRADLLRDVLRAHFEDLTREIWPCANPYRLSFVPKPSGMPGRYLRTTTGPAVDAGRLIKSAPPRRRSRPQPDDLKAKSSSIPLSPTQPDPDEIIRVEEQVPVARGQRRQRIRTLVRSEMNRGTRPERVLGMVEHLYRCGEARDTLSGTLKDSIDYARFYVQNWKPLPARTRSSENTGVWTAFYAEFRAKSTAEFVNEVRRFCALGGFEDFPLTYGGLAQVFGISRESARDRRDTILRSFGVELVHRGRRPGDASFYRFKNGEEATPEGRHAKARES